MTVPLRVEYGVAVHHPGCNSPEIRPVSSREEMAEATESLRHWGMVAEPVARHVTAWTRVPVGSEPHPLEKATESLLEGDEQRRSTALYLAGLHLAGMTDLADMSTYVADMLGRLASHLDDTARQEWFDRLCAAVRDHAHAQVTGDQTSAGEAAARRDEALNVLTSRETTTTSSSRRLPPAHGELLEGGPR